MHVITGSVDRTAKIWPGPGIELKKAPLQLEAELDTNGFFCITCSNIGGEELGKFSEVDPTRSLAELFKQIEVKVSAPKGWQWAMVVAGDVVEPSELNKSLADAFAA